MRRFFGIMIFGAVLLAVAAVAYTNSAFHSLSNGSQAAQAAASQSCAYSTPDGDATAVVMASGSVCGPVGGTLEQGLAGDGRFWAPYTGVNPGSPMCSLSAGDSTMTVYDFTGVQEPIVGGVASGVCASEEANGWVAS